MHLILNADETSWKFLHFDKHAKFSDSFNEKEKWYETWETTLY